MFNLAEQIFWKKTNYVQKDVKKIKEINLSYKII